jgi:hypothetical protein
MVDSVTPDGIGDWLAAFLGMQVAVRTQLCWSVWWQRSAGRMPFHGRRKFVAPCCLCALMTWIVWSSSQKAMAMSLDRACCSHSSHRLSELTPTRRGLNACSKVVSLRQAPQLQHLVLVDLDANSCTMLHDLAVLLQGQAKAQSTADWLA